RRRARLLADAADRRGRTRSAVLVERCALDRDAVQEAPLALVIVEREMPGRAVVPQGQRALAPPEAAGEFRPRRVPVQVVEERARLFVRPALEAQCKAGIDVERLAAGFPVADDDGMHGVLCRQFGVAEAAVEIA